MYLNVFKCGLKCVNVSERGVYLSVSKCLQVWFKVCECIREAGVFKCI